MTIHKVEISDRYKRIIASRYKAIASKIVEARDDLVYQLIKLNGFDYELKALEKAHSHIRSAKDIIDTLIKEIESDQDNV